jgi:hypothetical protein
MKTTKELIEALRAVARIFESREVSIPYKEFFRGNKNRHGAFAGAAFDSTKQALAFMDKLASLGATEIVITNVYDEDWRIKEEGGAYADAVNFKVPDEKKDEILKFVKSKKPNELDEVSSGVWRAWWD